LARRWRGPRHGPHRQPGYHMEIRMIPVQGSCEHQWRKEAPAWISPSSTPQPSQLLRLGAEEDAVQGREAWYQVRRFTEAQTHESLCSQESQTVCTKHVHGYEHGRGANENLHDSAGAAREIPRPGSARLFRPGRDNAVRARISDRLPKMLVLIPEKVPDSVFLDHFLSEYFHRSL
jgi:hypothetical protein